MWNKFMSGVLDANFWFVFACECECLSTYSDDISMWCGGGEL